MIKIARTMRSVFHAFLIRMTEFGILIILTFLDNSMTNLLPFLG